MARSARCRALAVAAALAAPGCGGPEPLTSCASEPGVEVLCGFQNPEDLVAAPGGEWLLVSQFPRLEGGERLGGGSLLAFRPSDGARRALFPPAADGAAAPGAGAPDCPGPPDPAHFAPHGIDLAEAAGEARLLVVNHGGREAIESFALEMGAEGPRLRWQGCAPLPEGAQANDVAALPGGGFVASHMLPREPGLLDLARILLGLATGELLEWSPGAGWRAVPNTRASASNGVAASPDGETLWFAAWGGSRLVRVARDGSGRAEVALPHHPDNLSWDGAGRLLVAGQKGSIARTLGCAEIATGTCPLPSSVVRVEPGDLSFEPVWEHDPARLGGAASAALEHGGALWIGTFAGDRLLRVTEAR
jgi:hypothetical protein